MKKKKLAESLVEACDLLDWFVERASGNLGSPISSSTAVQQSKELLAKMKKKEIWTEPDYKLLSRIDSIVQSTASEQVAT